MKITVEVQGKVHRVEIEPPATIEQVLRRIGIRPSEFITVLNGEIVTELELLKDRDKIKLLKVWSGG